MAKFNQIIKKRKNQLLLFFQVLLVSINWGTWLYAVSVNRLLVSKFRILYLPNNKCIFRRVFLKEKLNKINL